jgi:hypothetical protein
MRISSRASSITGNSMLALVLGLLVAIPAGVGAQATQQAGKVSIVVPTAYVVRASQQLNAAPAMAVNWGDVINTGHLARARISLTDGSVLNVGSDSNLTVAKHDASAQQTDLDLNYGRVRARAVKLVKPDAHFQIRTSVGVAGVVGTEMIVTFETPEDTGGGGVAETAATPQKEHDKRRMGLICLEGECKLCDNALNCVLMKGGQISSIRGNEAPAQPAPVTPLNVTEAVNATKAAGVGATGAGVGSVGVVAVGAAVGGAVATAVVRAVAKTTTCGTPPPPTGGGIPHPKANCTTITSGNGHINGQRTPH